MTKFNITTLSTDEVEEKIKEIREWMRSHPNMPNNLGKDYSKISLILLKFYDTVISNFND